MSRTTETSVTPLDVKAGDRVLFGKYSGQEIKLETATSFSSCGKTTFSVSLTATNKTYDVFQ